MMDEKHGAEIFNGSLDQAAAVVWYLVHLLGGEVTFPIDEDFWDGAIEGETWLTLHKEDARLVLRANQRL